MLPVAGHEDLVEIPDSVIRNLAAAALILLLYAVLTAVEKKAGDKITIWCKRIAVTLGMLWQGIAGLCWVLAADRVPSADQASVIGAAIDFIQGDYGTLAPDIIAVCMLISWDRRPWKRCCSGFLERRIIM